MGKGLFFEEGKGGATKLFTILYWEWHNTVRVRSRRYVINI